MKHQQIPLDSIEGAEINIAANLQLRMIKFLFGVVAPGMHLTSGMGSAITIQKQVNK